MVVGKGGGPARFVLELAVLLVVTLVDPLHALVHLGAHGVAFLDDTLELFACIQKRLVLLGRVLGHLDARWLVEGLALLVGLHHALAVAVDGKPVYLGGIALELALAVKAIVGMPDLLDARHLDAVFVIAGLVLLPAGQLHRRRGRHGRLPVCHSSTRCNAHRSQHGSNQSASHGNMRAGLFEPHVYLSLSNGPAMHRLE